VTFEEAERYLLSLELFGMRFGLDRMRRLMTALGHPERQFNKNHGPPRWNRNASRNDPLNPPNPFYSSLLSSRHAERVCERRELSRHVWGAWRSSLSSRSVAYDRAPASCRQRGRWISALRSPLTRLALRQLARPLNQLALHLIVALLLPRSGCSLVVRPIFPWPRARREEN